MIIYNKDKSAASIVSDITYMLNYKTGHELWINNQLFQRYDSDVEVVDTTKQIIEAMINKEETFEII